MTIMSLKKFCMINELNNFVDDIKKIFNLEKV